MVDDFNVGVRDQGVFCIVETTYDAGEEGDYQMIEHMENPALIYVLHTRTTAEEVGPVLQAMFSMTGPMFTQVFADRMVRLIKPIYIPVTPGEA